jgi:pilus assembly protein Flp/PilA
MRRFLKDESGATAIEYGLIACLMVLGVMTALFAFRDATARLFGVILAGVLDGTS